MLTLISFQNTYYPQENSVFIGKAKVGKISINMTMLKVKKLLNNKCGNTRLDPHIPNNSIGLICEYKAGTLLLFFDAKDQRLFEIQIRNKFYQTKKRIKVGSYFHEVLKNYENIYLEKFHAIPMEKLVSICVPSMGWIFDFETKNLDISKIYNSEKKRLREKMEIVFEDLLLNKITVINPFSSCSEGE